MRITCNPGELLRNLRAQRTADNPLGAIDLMGDMLNYDRCDGCGHTLWRQSKGVSLQDEPGRILAILCNRCAKSIGYDVNKESQ